MALITSHSTVLSINYASIKQLLELGERLIRVVSRHGSSSSGWEVFSQACWTPPELADECVSPQLNYALSV